MIQHEHSKNPILPIFYNHLLLPFFKFNAKGVLTLLCIFSTHPEFVNFFSSTLPPMSIKRCHWNNCVRKSDSYVFSHVLLLFFTIITFHATVHILLPRFNSTTSPYFGRIMQEIFEEYIATNFQQRGQIFEWGLSDIIGGGCHSEYSISMALEYNNQITFFYDLFWIFINFFTKFLNWGKHATSNRRACWRVFLLEMAIIFVVKKCMMLLYHNSIIF